MHGVARGRLVSLPDSALPLFAHEIPDAYAEFLTSNAEARHGDIVFGVFVLVRSAGAAIHNSAATSAAASAETSQGLSRSPSRK